MDFTGDFFRNSFTIFSKNSCSSVSSSGLLGPTLLSFFLPRGQCVNELFFDDSRYISTTKRKDSYSVVVLYGYHLTNSNTDESHLFIQKCLQIAEKLGFLQKFLHEVFLFVWKFFQVFIQKFL